ncbi:4-hydroxy-3-methylbut-2-enyl diphosphate reductase [Streptomyces sp. NPDC048297]|uniref:4-hydroxy-3-methylbut-2-enyl diphosphate reductase n=1 Tax=Streptomyces sp. NPDC048297 TaxID=3365531 RepID=UPI003722F0D8
MTSTAGRDGSDRGKTVLVAAPSGFCAGVERAVTTVERALALYGAPVYVRGQIVHNRVVVDQLRRQGAVFVSEVDEVPEGAVVILSAHGVAPRVRAAADSRGLLTIDATCPLVSKVHREARRFASEGYDVLLIGEPGHDEVVGTVGVAPERTTVVAGLDGVDAVQVADPDRVAWLAQTTLTVDETTRVAAALRERFPRLVDPPSDDICYAAQNRQAATQRVAAASDLVLVVGSANSHNSTRLVQVALAAGTPAYLVEGPDDVRPEWLEGDPEVVGLTAGASAPRLSTDAVLAMLAERGYGEVRTVEVARENQVFTLPRELDQPRPRSPRATSTSSAIAPIVGSASTSSSLSDTPNSLRTVARKRTAASELPPSSKKLS